MAGFIVTLSFVEASALSDLMISVIGILIAVGALLTAFGYYIRSNTRGIDVLTKSLESSANRINDMEKRHDKELEALRLQSIKQKEDYQAQIEKLREQLRGVEAELNQQKGEKVQIERNLATVSQDRDQAYISIGKRDAEIATLTVQINLRDKTIQDHTDQIEALTARIKVLEMQLEERQKAAAINETPKFATEKIDPTIAAGEAAAAPAASESAEKPV
jgi:chromosome segregation ATPase